MKYDRVYPVPCPEPTCNAAKGEPCNTRNGLTHIDRLRDQIVDVQVKALAARRASESAQHRDQLLHGNGTPCRCAELRARKES